MGAHGSVPERAVRVGDGRSPVLSRTPIGGLYAATAASGFLAGIGDHVVASRMILVDIPMVFFSTLALLASTGLVAEGGKRDALLGGIWVGLVTACKYTGFPLVILLLLAHLIRAKQETNSYVRILRPGGMVFSLAAVCATFCLSIPYTLLDFGSFRKDFSFERLHMTTGHFGGDPTGTLIAYLTVM